VALVVTGLANRDSFVSTCHTARHIGGNAATMWHSLLLLICASLPPTLQASVPVRGLRPRLSFVESSIVTKLRQNARQENEHRHDGIDTAAHSLLKLRGGGAISEKEYRMQQHLLLQTRSQYLRQALLDRGLPLDATVPTFLAEQVDWDCALSTKSSPKDCLYTLDAQIGSKVIAPAGSKDWIMVSALNRLRRNDPSKVEGLWHSKFIILRNWFVAQSKYSIYTHLPPGALLLSTMLDSPLLMFGSLAAVLGAFFLITWSLWEKLIIGFLSSRFLWQNYQQWGRFLHASLPLKLFLAQMAFGAVSRVAGGGLKRIRKHLVELECTLLEKYTPLTIVDEGAADETQENEDEDDFFDLDLGDDEDDDDEYE